MIEKIFWHFMKQAKLGKRNLLVINDIVFPSEELIIEIHDFLISSFAKSSDNIHSGMRDLGTLQHMLIVSRRMAYGKRSKKRRIILCASCLFNYLAAGQCFVDGNKRTAYVITWVFLILNNQKVDFKSTNYRNNYHFIINISSKRPELKNNIEEIKKWIEKSIR